MAPSFSSPDEYLGSLSGKQADEANAVYRFLTETFPDLEQHMYSNIIGFGRDKDGWMLIGMCARSGYTAVYASVSVLDAHEAELGKLRTGKSCLSVKKWDKADHILLKSVLQETVERKAMLG
jgi:hypothetical protein